ncbi:MAG: sulfatase-like hydrolase/transferase [Anaerolineae bacterium]
MPTAAGYTNVILIVADDLGYGDLGVTGNRYLQTPFLDRLAAEGALLSQHYTGSPVSAPARASLFTGRYPHRVGALGDASNRGLDRIALRETTVAELFGRAGYATGLVGKWHNGLFDRRYHPNRRGFDEFVGFLNGGMHYYNWILDANGQPLRSDGRYLTDVLTDEAVQFVERHSREPFFLTVAYNAPHSPLQAPEQEIDVYREVGRFNEAVCRVYAMIHRMDAGIGRILEALDRLELTAQTLILFTSDNGPWLGDERLDDGRLLSLQRYNGPLRGMKGDVLEGGIRVPAIVRWPARLPAGRREDAMVHFCDWLPTLTAAAGILDRPDLPLDGVNVLPVLEDVSEETVSKRFWQFNRYAPVAHCNAAMRDGPWKLYWPRIPQAMARLPIDEVWYRGMFTVPHFEMPVDGSCVPRELLEPGAPQLYNLEDDPEETQDLAASHPDRVRAMQQDVEAWFEGVNADRRACPDVWHGDLS